MSTLAEDTLRDFLRNVLSSGEVRPAESVFVTLTFAQSMDAKIAGQGGKQLALSCKESMLMTHRYVFHLLYLLQNSYTNQFKASGQCMMQSLLALERL